MEKCLRLSRHVLAFALRLSCPTTDFLMSTVISDTDDFVTRLVNDWKRLRPQDWTGRQSTLGEMLGSRKGSSSCALSIYVCCRARLTDPLT